MKRTGIGILILMLTTAWQFQLFGQSILSDGQKVLFVGNGKVGSEGGLHNHFKRTMSRMSNPVEVETDWIPMYGMQTLDAMLTDDLKERIENGDDDLIVVQSGSIDALKVFADLVTDNGKKMLVYGIWQNNPFHDGDHFESFTNTTIEQYQELLDFQQQQKVMVAPCGLAFQSLMADRPNGYRLRQDYLFTPESSVSNDLSYLLNVSMLYSVLTGKSPVGLPMWNPFPKELLESIQEKTYQVYLDWKRGVIHTETNRQFVPAPPDIKADFPSQPLWPPILRNGSSIYFVGNSYIGTEGGLENHFPRLLSEIGSGYQPLTTSSIFWGQGLQRMFTDEVRQRIREGPEDIIVVTSGPREYLDKFYHEISDAEKTMVVHMTWGRNPSLQGMEHYKNTTYEIIKTCKEFESATGVAVVPCGLIYYDLIMNPPEIENFDLRQDWVFMEENIHQNHLGTMVNAAAHFAVLTGQAPTALPMWDPYPDQLIRKMLERTWHLVQMWKKNEIILEE